MEEYMHIFAHLWDIVDTRDKLHECDVRCSPTPTLSLSLIRRSVEMPLAVHAERPADETQA